jgi:hypothetical protein
MFAEAKPKFTIYFAYDQFTGSRDPTIMASFQQSNDNRRAANPILDSLTVTHPSHS